jgi:NitT/TauT family transport system ATP-binding protein
MTRMKALLATPGRPVPRGALEAHDPFPVVFGEPATSDPAASGSSGVPVVRLKNVTVAFDDATTRSVKVALKNVSLEVRDREFVVLVGRSGCGKTTVLNLLSGLCDAAEGTAEVLSADPRESSGQMGYMFARDALLPWRSAVRNVEFALELSGRHPRRERRESAMAFLDLVGLRDHAKAYPKQLSQGMRQRVALARTWAFDPCLLLMDEPFAALDAQTRLELQTKFLEIWESQRKTVIFVTHDLSEAIALADRIVVLREGQIVDQFAVPLARPRDPTELAETDGYHDMYHRLRRQI